MKLIASGGLASLLLRAEQMLLSDAPPFLRGKMMPETFFASSIALLVLAVESASR